MTGEEFPDEIDIAILDSLQDEFPLTSRPYRVLADRIGITEEECIYRISRLDERGVLRNISPVLESGSLGMHAGTLIAFHVPQEKVHEIAEIVNLYPKVTHNFIREHYYSLWFTLIGEDYVSVQKILTEILEKTGVPDHDILNLVSVKKYKADVRFPLNEPRGFLPEDGEP